LKNKVILGIFLIGFIMLIALIFKPNKVNLNGGFTSKVNRILNEKNIGKRTDRILLATDNNNFEINVKEEYASINKSEIELIEFNKSQNIHLYWIYPVGLAHYLHFTEDTKILLLFETFYLDYSIEIELPADSDLSIILGGKDLTVVMPENKKFALLYVYNNADVIKLEGYSTGKEFTISYLDYREEIVFTGIKDFNLISKFNKKNYNKKNLKSNHNDVWQIFLNSGNLKLEKSNT